MPAPGETTEFLSDTLFGRHTSKKNLPRKRLAFTAPSCLLKAVFALSSLALLLASVNPDMEGALWQQTPTVAPQYLSERKTSPALAQRVVTVAPSVTETIFYLGEGQRVVGVSRYDKFPEVPLKKLPRVGGFLDPNVEAILNLKPDLVIAVANAGNRSALERVAKFGVPVFVVPGNNFADLQAAVHSIAKIVGKEKRGRALTLKIRNTLKQLQEKTSSLPGPRMALVYGWNPLVLGGPKSFVGSLAQALGAKNIVNAKNSSPYPHYAFEHVVKAAPEIILDASDMAGTGTHAPWAAWTQIPAVKKGRVHVIPVGNILQPGPRIVEGLRQIAGLLYPQLR